MGKRQATGRSGTNRDGVIAVFVDWFFGSRRCILVFFVRGAGRIVFIFYFRKVEVFDSRAHATECSILGQREIVDTKQELLRVCYVVVMFTVCFPAVVHLFLSSVGDEIQAKAFGRSHFLSQVPESSDTLGQPAI